MDDFQYDVFISYSRRDYFDENRNIIPGNVVSQIKEALTNNGITYWFDEKGVRHGDDFAEKIVANIKASNIFLFIATENSNRSGWTKKEIAVAHELDKRIIPIRIDQSKYDPSVMFRIVDCDYIEYYKNPTKGIEDLLKTVNDELKEYRQREENYRKEEERKRNEREKSLKQAIGAIELAIAHLNNDEARIEIDRKQVLYNAQQIEDETHRKRLIELINNSGSIHLKHLKEVQTLKDEMSLLQKKIDELQNQSNTSEDSMREQEKYTSQLIDELNHCRKTIAELKKKCDEMSANNAKLLKEIDKFDKNGTKRRNRKIKIALIICIGMLAIGSIVTLTLLLVKSRYSLMSKDAALTQIAEQIPFIVKRISFENDKMWGDTIFLKAEESNMSDTILSRIEYIGLKQGEYRIAAMIYGPIRYINWYHPSKQRYLTDMSLYKYNKTAELVFRFDKSINVDMTWEKPIFFDDWTDISNVQDTIQHKLQSGQTYKIELWYDAKIIYQRIVPVKSLNSNDKCATNESVQI